jgi:hypothetical protein
MALEAIADELYGLRPDTFAEARDEHIKRAKADGDKQLAKELTGLRKPTQSAWLINLLWRDQRAVMEQLFELAADLSRAHARVSGPELQRLTAQRRQIEAALIGRARALAEEAGVTVSASMEREAQETLSAALAVGEVADEVRSGRLVKPASYAGFGSVPTGAIPTAIPARPSADADARPSTKPDAEKRPDPIELRAAQRARERREEAERRVQEAQAALDSAADTLSQRTREAEAAKQHQKQLGARLDELKQQLRALEDELESAEHAALGASRRRDQAETAHESAVRAHERAKQNLKDSATVS